MDHLQRQIELLRLEKFISQSHRGMERHLPVVQRVRPVQLIVGLRIRQRRPLALKWATPRLINVWDVLEELKEYFVP